MKAVDLVFTITLLALGTIHAALTPKYYPIIDIEAMWFAGTGLGYIYLAFLNFTRIYFISPLSQWGCFVGNLIALVFSILLTLEQEPQAYISVVTLAVLVLTTVSRRQMD